VCAVDTAAARQWVLLASAVVEVLLLFGVVAGNGDGLVQPVVVPSERLDERDFRVPAIDDLPPAGRIADDHHLVRSAR
jgi:hypothetical protein